MSKETLKDQLEDVAVPIKEGEKVVVSKPEYLERMARDFAEKHPDVDLTIINERHPDMDYDLYKFLRRVSNRVIKSYLRRT